MKQLVLAKKGYNIQVESWENDGDSYKTEQEFGLSLDELKRIHLLCTELFSDGCNNTTSIGNLNYTEKAKTRIKAFIEKYSHLNFSEDEISEIQNDLIGRYCDGDCRRVYSSMKIFHSAEDIILNEIDIKTL